MFLFIRNGVGEYFWLIASSVSLILVKFCYCQFLRVFGNEPNKHSNTTKLRRQQVITVLAGRMNSYVREVLFEIVLTGVPLLLLWNDSETKRSKWDFPDVISFSLGLKIFLYEREIYYYSLWMNCTWSAKNGASMQDPNIPESEQH